MAKRERAFKQMYEIHIDKIYNYMYWRTSDTELAKDLTSDVFTKAWDNWDGFDGTYPQAWLYTIAQNRLTDHWRKKRELRLDDELAQELESEAPPLPDQLAVKEDYQQLQRALKSLPSKLRDIITLRLLQGMSAKETGASLSVSEANVRVMQHRALKMLRTWYEEND